MDGTTSSEMIKDLRSDLARKYAKHGPAVETYWRSFDRSQRTKCMRDGSRDGAVLKHSMDRSLGNVYKLIPEWNLEDIADPASNLLLDMLKRRATTSLMEQYCDGPDGTPGDAAVIREMMDKRNLQHANPLDYSYTLFLGDDEYGMTYTIQPGADRQEVLRGFAPAIRNGLFVPQSTGELISTRQVYLLQCLNIIVEDILDQGSLTRAKADPAKRSKAKASQAPTAALSKLSIQAAPPQKVSLPDLVAAARDQKDALEEYLGLLTTEPIVLAHAVNAHFFSRPELIADEKGRRLPAHTDKYISAAFFETIHDAIHAAAIWNYTARLLELLEQSAADKVRRAVILQEVSNMCNLEYGRAQARLKRHVQTGTGEKWFRRTSNAFDKASNARVAMKGNPEGLTRTDPHLHYMLRLCQSETGPAAAMGWLKKLGDLYEAHPADKDKLFDREVDSLGDLAIITMLVQDLSTSVAVPPLSRKDGQAFISRSQELGAELNELKKQVDLRDFVVPIDNLLKPGVAAGALRALDHFVVEKAATKMGLLYYDMVEECVSDLEARCREAVDKAEQQRQKKKKGTAAAGAPTHFPSSLGPEPMKPKIEHPAPKVKTRPPEAATYEITPDAKPTGAGAAPPSPPLTPSQTLKVSTSTAEIFSALFDRSKNHGSVAWSAFEAAMADLGFSVVPTFGSVYTVLPPGALAVKRSLTLHRPHGSKIEGYKIFIIAGRLKRAYGWGLGTFTVR